MEEWNRNQWEQAIKNHNKVAFYLYTPMCGTCAVATKMLEVVENVVTDVPIGKANINFLEEIANEYRIESVPCLLISENGEIAEKIYAFQSVQNVYEKLKK
ncbi:thioredoxin [Ureibacillus massiliensis 4400831 = CIP 108448 = CCUG 49529]|uniref:Thioredoxin n=1 Tax=Ureibacillus massiliensis 4400831 = CIP 108448 = CCUG 49529 TaxID=1211035 RepID=A0A0A3J7A4_9BACL|nr:thioredoxin family protein [Ureibacillus massiliensis]KGR91635.1 thioredoxin [Ureibacillus massiliensis 4400831 = CIP 108448 = CCUG 49529]RKJ38485.1 thioredoxin [Butyricicoccus sp. 1XD8-22]